MPTFVVVTIILLLISVALLLAVTYRGDQSMTCPHCGLAFVANLYLVGRTALLACPFCRRWFSVTAARNRFDVKKILG